MITFSKEKKRLKHTLDRLIALLSNKSKLIIRPILIILIVSVVISAFHTSSSFVTVEGLTYDWRMKQTRDSSSLSDEIAVILIDDASLQSMDNYAGRWPWPRFVYADLLEFLAYAEPKGVLFDITFTEKHRFDREKGETINQDDLELVQATANYPFTYHAARFVLDSLKKDETGNAKLNKPLPENFEERYSIENRVSEQQPEPTVLSNSKAPNNNFYYLPYDELLDSSNGIGVVEVQTDHDSVLRRARLFHSYLDKHYLSLSTTALLDNNPVKSIRRDKNTILFDDLKIPVDDNEKMLVNYYGKYKEYSFSGIIASLQKIHNGDLDSLIVDPAELQGKYIFIGGSAAGLNDLKNTPMNANLPGVFIHASMLSNIIENDFLTPANSTLTYVLIFLFATITTLSVLLIKKLIIQNGLPVLSGVIFAWFAYYQFEQNIVIDIFSPLSSLGLAWILSFSAMVLMEGREKRKFKRMMSQYLSPAVLTTLVDNQEDFAKAEVGSTEYITMLFSDIRSFTNMSEKLSAEKVVELLNHYFSSMTDSIFEHEGTIDKFIGDAIMAFWGAPVKSEDHADKATLSALDMIERLKDVNIWIEERGLDPIKVGIGIHTGDAILGNIGSENKLDYTIIGDNVNLASRIEGLTKQYGVSLLITEDTFNQLRNPIPCLVVDLVRVKGKKIPIKVLMPLGTPKNAGDAQKQEVKDRAEAGNKAFQYYINQQWDEAISTLRQLPDEPVHQILLERCEKYKKTPPDKDWDGVFTMTSK